MVKIVWTEIAIEDLQLIHEYISKDSKLYAERLIEKSFKGLINLKASKIQDESFRNLKPLGN